MKRTILASLIAAIYVTPAIADEYHTVTWFADHPSEISKTLKWCRDNSGIAESQPNCINADDAGTLILERQLNEAAKGHHPAGLSQYGLVP